MSGTELHQVPVTGGVLEVELHRGQSAPVLAVHGISSQRRLWDWLRQEAPEITVVAPDLRGRGGSIGVPGPFSIGRHADDMVAVLDALELEAVTVCGMSMGGFVAVELANRYPARVKDLVLVDGGFPMARPDGLTREMLPAVFADRLGRLDHSWDSLEDYHEFFSGSTAPLLDPADPLLRDYLAHDLVGGKVRLSGDALLGDAADIYFGDLRWQDIKVPTRFLHAQWSRGADSPPAYPAEAVHSYQAALPGVLSTCYVAGVDHAGSIMTPAGAKATAALLREALSA
jgi:pimeloyl-ACP methyl ester carboxylesterase